MNQLLPLIGYVVVVLLCSTAVCAAVIKIVRHFIHNHVREGHNDVLVPMFLTAGTLYAVLLAFLVIAVWESYGAAKDNAAEEASTLTTMYRQTNGMPAQEQTMFRELIRNYTEAVIKPEWAIQAATGGGATEARHWIAEIYRQYGKLKPDVGGSPISTEFLHTYTTVTADRNRRTLQAGEALPLVLWVGIIFGGAIVILMSCFLYMETYWPHAVICGIMSTMIVMLLIITMLFDRPFAGPLGLDPGAFEHSLTVYDSVDKGN